MSTKLQWLVDGYYDHCSNQTLRQFMRDPVPEMKRLNRYRKMRLTVEEIMQAAEYALKARIQDEQK